MIWICFCVCIYIYREREIYISPFAPAGCDTKSITMWGLIGLNLEFSFSSISCHTKVKEPSLPYDLLIAGGKRVGFTSFSRVFVLREMQTASSRI